MQKKKILIIVPYFGDFPDYFHLWLESCSYNSSINWLLITDNKEPYDYPSNVKVKYMSFMDLKAKVQKKFNFSISLNTPYKLCDYKPAYGYIFEDELIEYDFWGHCDVDLIFGDIRKFVIDKLLEEHDKLFVHGHFILYRNCIRVNNWFKDLKGINGIDYRLVYSSDEFFGFDEFGGKKSWGGIKKMIENSNEKQYKNRVFDDIYPNYYNFYSIRIFPEIKGIKLKSLIDLPVAFRFENGSLYRHTLINKSIVINEIMYVHFQKRNMDNLVKGNNKSKFIMIPNKFLDYIDIDEHLLINKCSRRFIYPFYLKLRYKNLLKKLSFFSKKLVR